MAAEDPSQALPVSHSQGQSSDKIMLLYKKTQTMIIIVDNLCLEFVVVHLYVTML